jgi:hypothetical protein
MGSRLLIVVGSAASGPEEVPSSVRSLIDAADEILVIAPTLPGRFEWLASATNTARAEADERLRTVLSHLEDMGAEAGGVVGADDPLLAFEDAIRQFAPDHLLIGLRSQERAGWQERGLLDQVLERFRIPLTVLSSDITATKPILPSPGLNVAGFDWRRGGALKPTRPSSKLSPLKGSPVHERVLTIDGAGDSSDLAETEPEP